MLGLKDKVRVYCSLTRKLIEMDSGVCFALLKVIDESGSKFKSKSVSIEISRSEVLFQKFCLEHSFLCYCK